MRYMLCVASLLTFATACESKSPAVNTVQQAVLAEKAPAQQSVATEWQTVQDWAGSGIKQTESFTTASREWRIYWKTKNEAFAGAGIFQVMVHQAGNDALVTLAANKQGTGSDVTYVRAPPGRYYLTINSGNVDWLVRVEDQQVSSGPPIPPSEREIKTSTELDVAAKEQAPKRKVSEQQQRADIVTMFIGALIKSKLVVNMDEDLRAIYVNGDMWRQEI